MLESEPQPAVEPNTRHSAGKSWPTPQDYNEALQHPKHCFVDPDLAQGTVALNALGLPRCCTGNFCSVYKVETAKGVWAVRCFLRPVADQERRYEAISKFILTDDLIYTVPFEYQSRGVRIGNKLFPIVKMEWIEGMPLDHYVRTHANDRQVLEKLCADFLEMHRKLYQAGIAHGDLQHGNVVVVGDELRLIDYDGIFVPALEGMQSNELGHPNYQHPDRSSRHFDCNLDNFSVWLIYCSLKAISLEPGIVSRISSALDECLLFRRSDLIAPVYSRAFIELEHQCSGEVAELSRTIRALLRMTPEQVIVADATQPIQTEGLAPLPETVKLLDASPNWAQLHAARLHAPHAQDHVAPGGGSTAIWTGGQSTSFARTLLDSYGGPMLRFMATGQYMPLTVHVPHLSRHHNGRVNTAHARWRANRAIGEVSDTTTALAFMPVIFLFILLGLNTGILGFSIGVMCILVWAAFSLSMGDRQIQLIEEEFAISTRGTPLRSRIRLLSDSSCDFSSGKLWVTYTTDAHVLSKARARAWPYSGEAGFCFKTANIFTAAHIINHSNVTGTTYDATVNCDIVFDERTGRPLIVLAGGHAIWLK